LRDLFVAQSHVLDTIEKTNPYLEYRQIGARITVTDNAGKKQIFDANTSGSYLSSNDPASSSASERP
jgi:hypothetical protein